MQQWFAKQEAGVLNATERRYADSKCGGGERWLLLAGAMNPPTGTNACERESASGEKSGNFLSGVSADINHMQKKIGGDLCDILFDLKCTTRQAKDKIRSFMVACKGSDKHPVLYYTGHGAAGSGNWCFSDGQLSFDDVKACCEGAQAPWIVIDCCYSGHWANLSRAKGWASVLAASPYFMTALDNGSDIGGNFTAWYCGATSETTRPIVCSDRAIHDHGLPASVKTEYRYHEWMKGELADNNRFVLAQYFHANKCSMSFVAAAELPRGSAQWGTRATYDSVVTLAKECWNAGKDIVHLSRGASLYGLYAVQGFGKGQIIRRGTWQNLQSEIMEKWGEGYRITSVCSCEGDCPWAIVMTQPKKHFLYGDYDSNTHGIQLWRTRCKWTEIQDEIAEQWKLGYCITALDHSGDQYFLVMTKASNAQNYWWGDTDGSFPSMQPLWDKGFSVSLMFKDPTDGRWLIVGTGGLSQKSLEGLRFNVKS